MFLAACLLEGPETKCVREQAELLRDSKLHDVNKIEKHFSLKKLSRDSWCWELVSSAILTRGLGCRPLLQLLLVLGSSYLGNTMVQCGDCDLCHFLPVGLRQSTLLSLLKTSHLKNGHNNRVHDITGKRLE